MPSINIEGFDKPVTVSDDFLRLSPQQQDATVQEIAHSLKAGPGFGERAKGALNALDAGLATGIAGLIGAPDAIANLGATGIHKATNFVQRQLGMPESPGPDLSKPGMLPTAQSAMDAIKRDYYGGAEPYAPKNKVEEYLKTIGEFVPAAAIGPGGVLARGAQVVVPAITSETAGQITKGTAAEPYARGITALVSSGGASLLSRPGTAARSIRESMPAGVTPQMVNHAEQLINDSAQRGIQLAWPEALSQVAGRPIMTNMMRHLEGAPQTEAQMAEFFANRPQNIDAAARQEFGAVSPQTNAPSQIGPAAGRAAEETVNGVRDRINQVARPYYDQASTVLLTPQEMGRVRALPGYAEARNAVRNDPQLNRYVANLPEDSVGFLNEVKKYLDTASENARAPVNAQRNMQRSAGYGSDATTVRDTAVNATLGNPARNYETALNIERQGREQFLQPLLDGPLGKIAARDTTTKEAVNALFPSNPLPNSAQEIATTVGALTARNPRAARDLVRAHIESTFNETSQALQSGANQAGGAKFRATLVGNEQQAANLESAVHALPNGGQIWNGFNRFLDIMEATGTRQNIGSRTAYNAELLRNQSASGIAGEAAKAVANPLRGAQFLADRYERYRLGRNLNDLADILTDPNSANRLRAIAQMPPGSPQAQNTAIRMITALDSSRRESQSVDKSRQ